jgi:UDP-N-acetylmuramoylalanine--D-glutamate ligase
LHPASINFFKYNQKKKSYNNGKKKNLAKEGYKMDFHNKKIGIWGFGIVGKAALKFFRSHEIPITVMDNKELSKQDYELLDTAKSNFVPQVNCNEFLSNNDLILASPGIDLRPFASYKEKFITELDIFSSHTKKPIIAITGTIGKTTVTHFLSKILQKHTTVQTGGNIGTGMLELLAQQDHEITLLEVSSFQLEPCQIFAPDLAIWTNLYPNHLDRHTTIEDYFSAKCAILAKQKNNQQALIPIELASRIIQRNYQGVLHFFVWLR